MYTKQEIEDKLREIVSSHLGCEPIEIVPSAEFLNDLGADSLDFVEMVFQVEIHFKIQIPDEVAEKIITFGNLVEYVTEAVKHE